MGTNCWLLNVSSLERDFQAGSPSCQKYLLLTLLAPVINRDKLVHCVRHGQGGIKTLILLFSVAPSENATSWEHPERSVEPKLTFISPDPLC